MTTIQSSTLDLQVSTQIVEASRELCDLKYHLDMICCPGLIQDFQNDWMGVSNTCAFPGDSFLSKVIPFLKLESDSPGKSFDAMVDCRHVLGASINGKPKQIKVEDVPDSIAKYSRHHPEDSLSRAKYRWYRPLGILVAHEGKRRVAFMRVHGNLPIAARVTPVGYPAPERLKLIEVSGHRLLFAMLDDRYLQLLERPDVTRRYLTAYGVKTLYWGALKEMPDLSLVNAAVKLAGQETVDIQKLNAFQKDVMNQQEGQWLCAQSIEGYDFNKWRRFSACVSVIAMTLTAFVVWTLSDWQPLELSISFLLGASAAFIAGTWTMRWRKRPDYNLLAAWFSRSRPN
jgi:hypothetical protein